VKLGKRAEKFVQKNFFRQLHAPREPAFGAIFLSKKIFLPKTGFENKKLIFGGLIILQ